MAFYSASPLTPDFSACGACHNQTTLGGPPALLGSPALSRLQEPAALNFAPASNWGMPQMQMMQLEVELMTLLTNLLVGRANPSLTGLNALPWTVPSVGSSSLSGGGLTGHTPPAPSGQPGGKSSFNIASFNVLGASHTAGGGNKPGMQDGVARMRGAVESMQKHNVDIAGMQEFQGPQQAAFKKLAPGYAMAAEKDNAVVWNKEKFKLVERRSVTIPYFEGHARQMPVVQLQDRQTGKRVWVVNIHNPADTKDHPHNAANRAKAISIEQHLMRELQSTGVPVMFVGDFNERNTVDNDMAQAGMDSARPSGARSEIDWILGSNGVSFSNYSADHSTQSSGTSDHPIIVSTATI